MRLVVSSGIRLAGMPDMSDPKTVLRHYLQQVRDDLIWKLDGLGERQARLPRTPTGSSLLGVLKHCLNVEAGASGPPSAVTSRRPINLSLRRRTTKIRRPMVCTGGRDEGWAHRPVPSCLRVRGPDDRSATARNAGRVPWWPPATQDVTLQRIIVHVIYELARHAGHADIMREQHDGEIGWQREKTNVPTTKTGRHTSPS